MYPKHPLLVSLLYLGWLLGHPRKEQERLPSPGTYPLTFSTEVGSWLCSYPPVIPDINTEYLKGALSAFSKQAPTVPTSPLFPTWLCACTCFDYCLLPLSPQQPLCQVARKPVKQGPERHLLPNLTASVPSLRLT